MRKLGLVLAVTLLSAFTASADIIDGSMPVSALGADLTGGSDLSTATIIRPLYFVIDQVLTGQGTGDFSLIPPGTSGTNGVIDLTSASTIDAFELVFSPYGKFTASKGEVVSRSANEVKMFYIGTYSGLGAFSDSPMTFRVSIGYSAVGNEASSSYNGTLASPVPEPSTYAFVGLGLGALVAMRRRLR